MGRKITAVRIDHSGNRVSLRAMSKSLRGSSFALRGVKVKGQHVSKDELKAAITSGLIELLGKAE